MPQQQELRITGLNTNPSILTGRKGSLAVAENVNIESTNIARSRRGFKKYGVQLNDTTSDNWHDFFNFQDKIIAHFGDQLYYDSDGAGTWVGYTGTYTAPDSKIGIRSIQNNGSFFFTTDEGIKKLESVTGTIRNAGVPKGITITGELTGSSGFFNFNTQVAYRVVWGYKDLNNITVLGSPSERLEITNPNTSGQTTKDVILTIYIPSDITVSYFYQVYRSSFSANEDTIANDELQLIYEGILTSNDISNGYITFTDNVPDSLRGATIYTASTQEGIDKSNDLPPLAKDITQYKNVALYANTRTKHRRYLTILSVGGTDGLQIGDVVKINGINYTASGTQDHTAGEFKMFTSETAAENIRNTAKSLVEVINRYASNTDLYAYYLSGYDDLPGKILIERRTLVDTTFYITYTSITTGVTVGTMFEPVLPVSGTSVASNNENKQNRIYISKLKEPEAVPLLNYIDVGSQNSGIIRAIALRDSVFFFKDDGEVYRLTGTDPSNFEVILFESVLIVGAKTAQVFNNQIFTFSDNGIVSVTDNGVEIKSWDIEDQIISFLSLDNRSTFESVAFGIGYDSDRKYIMYDGSKCWVYHALTDCWTNWTINKDAGFINPTDDKLYWGDDTGYAYRERKAYTRYDYTDDEIDVTIVSASNYDVTLSSTTGVTVGDTLKQGDRYSYITTISTGNVITVDTIRAWTAGAAITTTPIECKVKWLPISADNPGYMKRFNELTISFQDINDRFTVKTSNNFAENVTDSVEITPSYDGLGWGDPGLEWGNFPWGGRTSGKQQSRTYFPLSQQRALWINVEISSNKSFTKFDLNAVMVSYEFMDKRFQKQ